MFDGSDLFVQTWELDAPSEPQTFEVIELMEIPGRTDCTGKPVTRIWPPKREPAEE